MLTKSDFAEAFARVAETMAKHKDYLVKLDQVNGDGDLGLSMDSGFGALADCAGRSDETDLGRFLMKCSQAFNEAAPSSLGTIISFGLVGMAKSLKGKDTASREQLGAALDAGIALIMDRAGSKPGEKTILDSLVPAKDAFLACPGDDLKRCLEAAAKAAASGAEATRAMRSVHGRAAYYGDKSIGVLDGGAEVGRLIFESIAKAGTDI